MGILDDVLSFVKTPEGQGLLSGVAGYAAGARRDTPINNIGRGVFAGVQGYGAAQDQQMQKAQFDQMSKLRDMQIGQMNRQLDLNKRLGEALQAGSQPNQNVTAALSNGLGPTIENAQKLQALNASSPALKTLSPGQALAKAAQEAGDYDAFQKAQALLIEEKKLAPKYKQDFVQAINPETNKLENAMVADDGTYKFISAGVKPSIKTINLNNRTVAYDENSIAPGTEWRMGMSPDASARLAFDRQQAAAPVFNADAGGWLYKPTAQNPNGVVAAVPGFSKPLTSDQGKAVGFLERMSAAEKILSDPKLQEGDRPGFWETTNNILPWTSPDAANVTRSAERQQYRQAQEDWVRAKLRKESGAAIGKDEMDREISQYFPVIGDDPQVVAQKAESRRTALGALHKETGGSYKMPEIAKAASKSVTDENGKVHIVVLGSDGSYYGTGKNKGKRWEE